jgi:hypothetical protein
MIRWRPQFLPVDSPKDLSLRGYLKHDGKRLYFGVGRQF